MVIRVEFVLSDEMRRAIALHTDGENYNGWRKAMRAEVESVIRNGAEDTLQTAFNDYRARCADYGTLCSVPAATTAKKGVL